MELLWRRPTLNSALDGVSSKPHGPAVVPTKKEARVLTEQKARWSPSRLRNL